MNNKLKTHKEMILFFAAFFTFFICFVTNIGICVQNVRILWHCPWIKEWFRCTSNTVLLQTTLALGKKDQTFIFISCFFGFCRSVYKGLRYSLRKYCNVISILLNDWSRYGATVLQLTVFRYKIRVFILVQI